MRTQNRFSFRVLALLFVSVVFLSACSQENPEKVMEKFKQNLAEVESGKVDLNMVMKGTSEEDTLDFIADLSFIFDHREEGARKSEVGIAFGGEMVSGEETLSGDVDLTIRNIGDEYYLRLDQIETNDERYLTFKPFVTLYMKRWLHVASDLIPENVRELNAEGEALDAKREEAKKLFLGSNLFVVKKDLGMDSVNGKETYHYLVALDEEGVKEYIANSARLDGRELTLEEIDEASKIATAIDRAELWIGKGDYYVYKALVSLSNDALGVADELGSSAEGDMAIEVIVMGSDYNKAVTVDAPADATEFNPLELLMGASNLELTPTEAMEEGGVAMEEAEAMMKEAEEAMEKK